MKAKFKSKLLLNFDEALADAKKHGMEIEKFTLETPEELAQLQYWIKKQGEQLFYDDMSYLLIPIEIPHWLRVHEELTD